MQRTLSVLLVTLGLALSQTRPPSPAKRVTVTGCIYQGVECLILRNLKGKPDYSLVLLCYKLLRLKPLTEAAIS